MKIKDHTVNLSGMTPQLMFGLTVANEVYKQHGFEMVITSVNDAKHSRTSLHYSGNAADLRTVAHDPAYRWDKVAVQIKEKLSADFDVINESNHIHLEWQPRRKD